MKILLVEDDWTSLQLLQRPLQKLGHEVVGASNGRIGWDKYQQGDFSLVISDWMMPEMDGTDLCRMIRANPRESYTFVILLTSKTDKESLLEAFDAGVDDFLPKPFDPAEIAARIRGAERILALEAQLASRVEELANANDRMRRDLQAAARIQEALLPGRLPQKGPLRFAWEFHACDELAGDSINVVPLGDNHVAAYLLDVSGHGVAAALMSVTLSRLLSGIPGQSILLRESILSPTGWEPERPEEVLARLNERFQISESTGGQYFTIVYALFDLVRGTVTHAAAGHPAAIYAPANAEATFLDSGGLPIGFIERADYAAFTVPFRPGDRLLLYSDGIIEAKNHAGELFGLERLRAAFQANRSWPLSTAVHHLVTEAAAWNSEHKPEDDVSILAAEWKVSPDT